MEKWNLEYNKKDEYQFNTVVPDRSTFASLTRVPIAFGSLEMNKFIHHATAHPVIAQHLLH